MPSQTCDSHYVRAGLALQCLTTRTAPNPNGKKRTAEGYCCKPRAKHRQSTPNIARHLVIEKSLVTKAPDDAAAVIIPSEHVNSVMDVSTPNSNNPISYILRDHKASGPLAWCPPRPRLGGHAESPASTAHISGQRCRHTRLRRVTVRSPSGCVQWHAGNVRCQCCQRDKTALPTLHACILCGVVMSSCCMLTHCMTPVR